VDVRSRVGPGLAAEDHPHHRRLGPGGGTDIVSRILAQSMQEKLGQPVVIENRPGAGGTIGAEAVARADKDGYTLGMMTNGHVIAATLAKSMRYDTLTAFDPVGLVATAASQSSPARASRRTTSRIWSMPQGRAPARLPMRASASAAHSISPARCSGRFPA
jgi:hypothetical protein